MVVFGGLSSIYFWIVHWLYTVFASTARSHFLVNAYIAFDEDVLIGNPETDLHLAILLNQMAWWPILVLPFTLMLLYFPEGKLLSPRWRIVINATVLSCIFGMITTFHPRPDKEWGITEPNPAGIKGSERLLERLAIIYMALFFIAVFFQHLPDRLQRSANRLLYGERDDLTVVLTRLTHHSEATETPTAMLPNLVLTIPDTLKIP